MSGIGISSPYRRCSGQPRLSEFEFDIDGLSCRLPSGYEVGRERRPGAGKSNSRSYFLSREGKKRHSYSLRRVNVINRV